VALLSYPKTDPLQSMTHHLRLCLIKSNRNFIQSRAV